MSRTYSMIENGAETSKIKRFFQKDFSQVIIFAIPMLFIAFLLIYPMAITLVRAFWSSSYSNSFSSI